MITQTIDTAHFHQRARRIRSQVSTVLTKWGLLPRFSRWRLTQDPGSGMVVLFGILNNKYIATRTSIPFSDYFDPRLLHDLADELQVSVVSCNSDGLRYAFVLDRGQVDVVPTHIDYPFLDGDRLLVRVIYDDPSLTKATQSQVTPSPSNAVGVVTDQKLVQQGVGAFLKVFDDIKLKDEALAKRSAQSLADIVVIDKDEFNKRVAEHEANRQRSKHIRDLFGKTAD